MSVIDLQIFHLVLRVPLTTPVDGRPINTLDAHNEVARRTGRVAVAKFGQPGTKLRAEVLRTQIRQQRKTWLVLVSKRGSQFLGFQAPLISVHHGMPTPDIRKIAPPYYEKLDQVAELWLTVEGPFVAADLRRFRLATNQRPLLEVISECRTSSMLVEASPM